MIESLINLVNEPEPEHPLRADLAEEYQKDRKKFMKNAYIKPHPPHLTAYGMVAASISRAYHIRISKCS